MESANPLSSWAQRFAITRNRLFFNHAAVAPISPAAGQALQEYTDYAQQHAYVGSNWYARLDHTRQQTARLLNAHSPEEIAFVPNTSTGLALVARGLDWRKGDEVVITNVEYPANRYPWEDLKRFGVRVVEVEQTDDCRVPLEAVLEAITDRTRVVSISHVQYATGHRIDLKPIADMVHQAGGCLCVDAIQSLGCLPVDVQASGIDFLSADGHKWPHGPIL
jgi:selenocysteine lyase/cysteine desulfurase